MLIYVSGDSHAAGIELGDYILPNWPGLQSTQIINQEWDKSRHSLYKKYESVLFKLNKKLSWAGVLQEQYKVDVINSAKGGASLAGITNRTVFDLLRLKKENKLPNIVFIQLTSMYRYEIYKNTTKDSGIVDLSVATIMYQTGPLRDLLLNYTNEDFAVKYLHELLTLYNSVYGITGKYPILLSTNISDETVCHINQLKETSELVDQLVAVSPINNVDLSNTSIDDIHKSNNFLYGPSGHYEQRTHAKYAEEIFNRYISNV